MHRLLKRQINKYFNSPEDLEKYSDFIQAIDAAYQSFDEDFRQLERTLEISSKESFKELSDFKHAMSISSMVVITNNRGIIKYVNDNYLQASGYSESDMIGKDIRVFNSDYHPKEFFNELNNTILRGKVWKGEICDVRKDGSYYWTDTTIVPLMNEAGIPYKFITYKFDISLMKEAEAQMLEAKKQAEKALEVKSEFLSNMSHEIRTPMNAILGLTDIILQKKHDKETTENLRAIKHSGENLLVIINDILDFSKLEAGKMNIEEIDFNFHYQINHIIKSLQTKANEKGIYLKTDIDPTIPQYLKGDPYRINQVLINLLGNAIKFTAKGGVTLKVTMKNAENKKIKLKYSVIDTGIGIAPGKINSIFESFNQADANITRNYGGTGLGLAISLKLVNLMGGNINVKSTEGEGSDFSFELPLGKSENRVTSPKEKAVFEKNISGVRILVCEDNLINQKVIIQLLSSWGCYFDIADNGQTGLELLKRKNYDLVLMDLQMPVKNGYETASEIRQGKTVKQAKDIPIIALTADAFSSTKEKVLDTGMNDFISKPFNHKLLNNKIYTWANKKNG